MKKLYTLLALTISFSLNAQLTSVTEGGNTGQRLSISNASNHGDIGSNAVDLSYQPSSSSTRGATGERSTATGYYTTASGNSSTATGAYTTASGDYSTAMGGFTDAIGDYSTAMGWSTTASDYSSTVIGQYNSSGSSATSAGSFSTSAPAFVIGNGINAIAKSDAFKVMFNGDAYISSSLYLGGTAVTSTAAEINYVDGVTSNVQAQLDSKQATITGAATTIATSDLTVSRALTSNGSGKVEVSAVTSTELGYLDGVTSAVQTQLDSKLSSSSTTFSNGIITTSLLTSNITLGGNVIIPDAGTIGSTSDTDAMTIAANGNTTFSQDITVSGDVVISSDARLKSNIVSLGSTLSKLLQIDGKSYEMKGKQKIGVLAQDIEKVFPELVSESNGVKSVNYQGLVPVLINALKEQQAEIDRLKTQEERLERLETLWICLQ